MTDISRRTLHLCLLAWLLTLSPVLLCARDQVLPTVDIGSDTVIKAPLIRKPLLYPLPENPDSLPPYLPNVFSLKHRFPQPDLAASRTPYLSFGLDTDLGTNLQASLYPSLPQISQVRVDASFSVPNSSRFQSSFNGLIRTKFGLINNLRYQHATGFGFSSTLFSYALDFAFPELEVGEIRLFQMQTRVSLENLDQEHITASSTNFAANIEHSQTLNWKGHILLNGLYIQDNSFGLAIRYPVRFRENSLPDLNVGLMTDFVHLLPAVDIHQRVLLAPDRYLELSNRSSIQTWQYQFLYEQHPWTYLPAKSRLTLTPLNLSLQASQILRNSPCLKTLYFSQNVKYSYNVPQLNALPLGGQTFLTFSDLLSNSTQLTARLVFPGVAVEQALKLNLEHLPNSRWQRNPYSPLFQAKTTAYTMLGVAELEASLNQEYGQRNESGQALPAVFDLGFTLKYPVTPDLQIITSLQNLFNTPYHTCGNLPNPGRKILLSFRYFVK